MASTLDRRVQDVHDLAGLCADRLDRRPRVDLLGPLAVLHECDHRIEDAGGVLDLGRLLPRRRIDLHLVVGGEEERHLVGDLHERRRPHLRQAHRRLEARDVEPLAVAVTGERQHGRDQVG